MDLVSRTGGQGLQPEGGALGPVLAARGDIPATDGREWGRAMTSHGALTTAFIGSLMDRLYKDGGAEPMRTSMDYDEVELALWALASGAATEARRDFAKELREYAWAPSRGRYMHLTVEDVDRLILAPSEKGARG